MPVSTTATFTIDDKHRLQTSAGEVEGRNVVKDQRTLNPEAIVIHYTGGASAASSADTLGDPDTQVSAHLVIGRGNEVIQVTPFDKVAWHAGRSSYTFPDGATRSGFNGFSIGIEIDNPGVLDATEVGWKTWFGKTVDAELVLKAVHRNEAAPKFWHTFTEDQITLTQKICRALVARYGIKHIFGHEEISPGRKVDPGPAFPLDRVRANLLGANRRDDTVADLLPRKGTVTASRLNIRADASPDSERVARALEQGASVVALKEQDGWYYVRAQVEGWVASRHIDLERS